MDQQNEEPGERPALTTSDGFDAFAAAGPSPASAGPAGGVPVPGPVPGEDDGSDRTDVFGGVLDPATDGGFDGGVERWAGGPAGGRGELRAADRAIGWPAGRGEPDAGGRDVFGGAAGPDESGGDDQDSFDAFAAGAVRPGAGQLVPLTPPAAHAALVRVAPSAVPAVRQQQTTSLFDSALPVPKMTARPVRDPLTAEIATSIGGSARIRRVVSGDFLLTVNPVDGTEVSPCPPEERRIPVRRTAEERAARIAGARPAPPPGPLAPAPPPLEREEEKERLIRLLARGRSVRVTGPSGAGRTVLLESVANACGDLAPAGVLWLSGYRRTAADLLQDLYSIVYASEGYRPGRAELSGLLREVGAIVVVDDLELGGAALEDLLATAPECAFLMSATPDVPAPAPDSMVEEVFLSGLTRVACLELLRIVTGRRLEEDETAWAADLWFESEGLPLRFVQAGALLRQRDSLRYPPEPDWDDSVWEKGSPDAPAAAAAAAAAATATGIPDLSAFDEPAGRSPASASPVEEIPARLPAVDVPLPSLAESAAPADLLASRLSESAREALAFAVALDGECPHAAHLPALVGDTHGDSALGELTAVGLAVPVSSHFRLAVGVAQQLSVALAADGDLSDTQAHTAALHYAWWSGHSSVTPEQATAEADAIIAAMAACRDGGHPSTAVLLARTVAPAFATALHWGAWERALRVGQEAARLAGEVAEEAYFHHELGVLALCTGNPDRARAELEASIALRAALADRQGTVVGRRTLTLINDRSGTAPLELLPPAALFPAETTQTPPADTSPLTLISKRPPAHGASHGGPHTRRRTALRSRRNLVAACTGVLLAAVLGTIVTLGATAGGGDTPSQVRPIESVQQDPPDDTTLPPQDGTTAAPPASASAPSSSASTATSAPGSTSGTTTAPNRPAGGAMTSPPVTITSSSPAGGTQHTTPPPTTRPTTTPPPTASTSSTPPSTASPAPSTSPPTTPPSVFSGHSAPLAAPADSSAATTDRRAVHRT
jgi:hypothetical protein